jgi:predicted  nucleic acid-binding Zn-ribbon protein
MVDIIKIQSEMNSLVERRLAQRKNMDSLKAEKAEVQASIKSAEKEMESIDQLFQEKIDELNKYRGISEEKRA